MESGVDLETCVCGLVNFSEVELVDEAAPVLAQLRGHVWLARGVVWVFGEVEVAPEYVVCQGG